MFEADVIPNFIEQEDFKMSFLFIISHEKIYKHDERRLLKRGGAT